MIRVDREVEDEEVAAEAVYSPDDTSSFELHGGPFSFVVESHTADKNKQVNGTHTLFLFKSGVKAAGAGVAIETKTPGSIGDSVPVGEA